MKKFLTIALLAAVSTTAMAQGVKGGFNGGNQLTTIQAVQNASDNAPVAIEGYLVKQLKKDKFIFKDVAGQEITVDVDDDAWAGQTIVPTDKIRIQGEVDKEMLSATEIDVDAITKL